MARVNLIQFDSGEYGIAEVEDDDALIALFNDKAAQVDARTRTWRFVRPLAGPADGYDPDDRDTFWTALEGVVELTPQKA